MQGLSSAARTNCGLAELPSGIYALQAEDNSGTSCLAIGLVKKKKNGKKRRQEQGAEWFHFRSLSGLKSHRG